MKLTSFAAFCLVVTALPAAADTRDDVMARAAHCGTVNNGRQWLDCYYAAAQPLRAELGLAPAPQSLAFEPLFAQPGPKSARPSDAEDDEPGFLTALVTGKPKRVAPEQFGLKNAKPGPGYNVDRIVSKMSSYDAHGNFTVTLTNGQIWGQMPGDGEVAHWNKPASTYTVTISYGAFGTYNLRTDDNNSVYKVTRLR